MTVDINPGNCAQYTVYRQLKKEVEKAIQILEITFFNRIKL